jgi:uncharacterized iron-regulated membrane protein
MNLKKLLGMLHLWLGLATGLVIVVSFVPAALFVWDKELTNWYYGAYVYVEPSSSEKLPLSVLFTAAQKAVDPSHRVEDVEIENDPRKAYVFSTYRAVPEDQHGWTYFSEMAYWEHIYVNPYTGQVTGVVNKLTDWIYLTRVLHQQLLLNYKTGHLIVGMATLLLFIMVASGLVLWWPRNKAALKQRFTIKWNARWRRKNYDLHNVGGFYSFLLILIFATTGLVWTFDWWTNGIYRLLGDDPATVFPKHEQPLLTGQQLSLQPLDIAFADVLTRKATWVSLYLSLPGAYGDEANKEINAYLLYDENSGWEESNEYAYHPETGLLHHARTHEQKTLGAKWRNSNYAIHVGSIYGWPTKILATFTALFCASLPVSGFLIWWGRRKKTRRQSRQSREAHVAGKKHLLVK